MNDCVLCDPERSSRELMRLPVWEDDLWRLSKTLVGAVPGFSYLEPRRHVEHTDLDGAEAASFGSVVARVATALKDALGASLVSCTSSAEGSRICTSISRRIPRATPSTPLSSAESVRRRLVKA